MGKGFFTHARALLALTSIAFACLNVSMPQAAALTAVEATQRLNACIAAINDPLYTRATLPGLMSYTDIASLESAIANNSLVVWIANGAGVIAGSGGANGQGKDLFCGDGSNNDVAVMDSGVGTRDFFFGGAGNDRVTANMWGSTFYGGPGDDYVNQFDESSFFSGGPGNDTYGTILGGSTFDQGTDADTTPPTFPSAETFNVFENTTTIATITTSESATISLDSGSDRLKFLLTRISNSSAALSFIIAPDFEIPTDTGLNNIYNVVIKAVDASANIGYENIAVTVVDVIDTSTFSSFAVTGNPTLVPYLTSVNLVAVISVASRITFTANNKRIAGCISRLATGSAGVFTAICSWRPTQKGSVTLSSQSVAIGAGITGALSSTIRIFVGQRLTRR